jgi:hypothetical protein
MTMAVPTSTDRVATVARATVLAAIGLGFTAAAVAGALALWNPDALARLASAQVETAGSGSNFMLDVAGVQWRAACAAGVYLAVASVLVLVRDRMTDLVELALDDADDLIAGLRSRLRAEWRDIAFIGLVTAATLAGLVVAARAIPMRLDESTTYLHFGPRPVFVALGLYVDPNNHVLHTLLMKLSTSLFGAEPWAVRLPALLVGACLPGLGYLAARRLYDRDVAIAFAVLLPATTYFLEFAANARGYTIVLAAFLASLALAPSVLRGSPGATAGLIVAGALGAYAVPIMAYPFAIVLAWITLGGFAGLEGTPRLSGLLRAAGTGAATLGIVLMLYSPIAIVTGPGKAGPVDLIQSSVESSAVERASLFEQYWREALLQWRFPLPEAVGYVALLAIAAGIVLSLAVYRPRGALLVAGAATAVPVIHAASAFAMPPPWSLCFLYLGAVLMVAVTLAVTMRAAARLVGWPTLPLVLMPVLALVLVVQTVRAGYPFGLPYSFGFPDGPAVAGALQGVVRSDDVVLSRNPHYQPLRFNLRRLGEPWQQRHIRPDGAAELPADRGIVVIDRPSAGEPPLEAGRLPDGQRLVLDLGFRETRLRLYRPTAETRP